MYFEIPRKDLLNPLKSVRNIVEQRTTLPILTNILVSVRDNQLYLTGTDTEVEISCTVPLETTLGLESNGQVTLSAHKLFDIIRSLPTETTLQISAENNRAILRAGKSRFTLSTLPAEDFPASPTLDSTLTFQLSQQQFKNLLSQTSYAMATNDPRYYLNGLCLDITANLLTAVATDGHRMALALLELTSSGSAETTQIIIPRKAVTELQKVLENKEEMLDIVVGNNAIKISSSPYYTLNSKLIDGRFPDYVSVIPNNLNYSIRVDINTFKSALAQVIILSHEKHRGARLNFSAGKMVVSARNPDQEEATVECEVDYSGEEFEIGFNVSYLQEALSALNTKEADLKFSSPDSSVLIMPTDSERIKMIVMPMRI